MPGNKVGDAFPRCQRQQLATAERIGRRWPSVHSPLAAESLEIKPASAITLAKNAGVQGSLE
ncbi:hypothetical protein [Metapseudomonas resinovorans]|uniref:hypothetical protein n=1 Tax=Metapseudomonas resinovorans TaxID=53412 RepID=UPI0003A2E209|nr:hypothetical protein [Pseudomonas resinovorans]